MSVGFLNYSESMMGVLSNMLKNTGMSAQYIGSDLHLQMDGISFN